MRSYDRFRIRELELEHRAEIAKARRAVSLAGRDLEHVRAGLQDSIRCSSKPDTSPRPSATASGSSSTRPAGERSS